MVWKGDADVVQLVVTSATNGDFFVKESERKVVGGGGGVAADFMTGLRKIREGKKLKHYIMWVLRVFPGIRWVRAWPLLATRLAPLSEFYSLECSVLKVLHDKLSVNILSFMVDRWWWTPGNLLIPLFPFSRKRTPWKSRANKLKGGGG
ncbi:hypothetical protein Acr_03g0017110 [Actinidia rufa]|uniref:Uncharacterized protein n=1 Tax=Actinidia rufa TaxID=165716 RepID=A0A7J0EH17_9ERIC|nr:hypothetical protein Acr_03g0017110 [Actinidia rufa]